METEAVPPPPNKQIKAGGGVVSEVILNFLIFGLCDAVYVVIFALLLRNSPFAGSELFATLMVDVYAGVAFFLALLAATVFAPMRLRTIWIIGAAGPPVMLLVFFIVQAST